MSSLNHDPLEHGLEILGQLSEDGLSYEFNDCIVWKDVVTQRLFYAIDSG